MPLLNSMGILRNMTFTSSASPSGFTNFYSATNTGLSDAYGRSVQTAIVNGSPYIFGIVQATSGSAVIGYVCKIDPASGSVLSILTLNGLTVRGIVNDSAGNIHVYCSTGASNIVLRKYSSTWTFITTKTFNSPAGIHVVNSISIDSSDNLYFAGAFATTMTAVKIDSSYNIVYTKDITGFPGSIAYGQGKVDSSGNLIYTSFADMPAATIRMNPTVVPAAPADVTIQSLTNLASPDINLDFTVDSSNINVTVEPNDITFTPTDINLSIFSSGSPVAGGSSGQLQYNNGGVLGGVANTSFANGNLTFTNLSNLKINGGTNGYVLQTDGTGNLGWTAQTGGGGGNGVPGGANTQIQYNDSGSFGGFAGFTFNETTGNVNIPNAVVATSGNIGNTQITANGILTPGVYGNITGANVITALTIQIANEANLAPNITINSNTNPAAATVGNTAATFKYPVTINGNVYYLNLTANI